MLKTLQSAFKIKDIRQKIFFTFLMLIVIRIGSQIPVPGVNSGYFAAWFAQQSGDALNFFDAFTGGSFTSMSIFALNISPYITSSIIIQLLTIAIPKLEEMQKEEDGRQKINKITRYTTVLLAFIEGTAMTIGFGGRGLLEKYNFVNCVVVIAAFIAGSTFIMWIGERISEKGIGNGISIVLLINILSRVPSDLATLFEQFVFNKNVAVGVLCAAIIIAIILVVVVLVIFLQDGERRIPVQYSKKMQGRKMVGGQSSHIPLKVNTAGVIPVIFASSLMQMPGIIASFAGVDGGTGIGGQILRTLNSSNWCNPQQPVYSIGLVIYVALCIFFAYFYTSITFNPIEVADNIKKQGGFIPGIRPGKPTTDYLTSILNYTVFVGAVGLLIIVVIPFIFNGVFHASVSFGGTSIIIIVGVILETLKQIESSIPEYYYSHKKSIFG
ncbi:preprotein translocase subunit SecY [Oscillospiraceae bacterium Marseille-Q3528]|nr:preprotein translocase subunit SecY [Oscillospiraceae bacterium Marseille-Q3528]